jgi:3,4-dihydroxy 2-butanone 4-phosphate synthase / GTP cyclohydrolase II
MLSLIFLPNTQRNTMNIQNIKQSFCENKPILIYDPERENEVDFVIPNSCLNNSTLHFMLQYGKGLLCCAKDQDNLLQGGFFPLPSNQKDPFSTNFFIPVDHHSVHTGIGIEERIKTLQALDHSCSISNFMYPGHIPLLGGIGLHKRKGHTEASLEICESAGFSRTATIIELLDERGDTHTLSYAKKIASQFHLPFCSVQDVYATMIQKKTFIQVTSQANLPTDFGNFHVVGFHNKLDQKDHFAVIKGDISSGDVFVRIHCECATGDVFHSKKCDCRDQLTQSLQLLEQTQKGVLLYLRQEGRGIGISDKIKAYSLQEQGVDTYDANVMLGHKADERDYAVAAQIIQALHIQSVILLTNNPAKIEGLQKYGIATVKAKEVLGAITPFNKRYIETKVHRFHHQIPLKSSGGSNESY